MNTQTTTAKTKNQSLIARSRRWQGTTAYRILRESATPMKLNQCHNNNGKTRVTDVCQEQLLENMTKRKEIIMKNQIVKLAVSLVALAGLLSGMANAQSCSTWAQNVISQQTTSSPSWGALLTTNNGAYVSYSATGGETKSGFPLTYVAGHWSGGIYFPPSLRSTGSQYQYFSDRPYSADINGQFYQNQPFSPAATDSLGLTIWLGTGGLFRIGSGYSIQPGQVTFTLYTYGGSTVTYVPERCDGMIYGLSGNSGLLLSLITGILPPPRLN